MRTGSHCRLATNRQRCRNHHCQLATNRHCYRNYHCRLATKRTVLTCSTLSAWAMNRQWWLRQHCRFEPWTDSVGLLNTAGLSQEPTLLKQPSLSVGTTNRQCCSTRHCRMEPETDTVSCRSVSVFKNRQWCQPPSLSVCHCRFKIHQWSRFLNRQWCSGLG